jgi:hypothetical protein
MAKSKPFNTSPHSVFVYGAREFTQDNTVSIKETLTAYCKRKGISKWRGSSFIKKGWLLATKAGKHVYVAECNPEAIELALELRSPTAVVEV